MTRQAALHSPLQDPLLTASHLTDLRDKPTVLVVDDDRHTLAFLEHLLTAQGYRVLLAADGEEALKALAASAAAISAVVMDLHMPGLNGLQVVAQMKQQAETALIPVIMATATEKPELIREGIDAGVYYCLKKPLDKLLLHSVVAAAIREFDMTRMRQEVIAGHSSAMALLETSRFFCRTLHDVSVLAQFLACAYPDPKRAVIGITELLINAVEHGNLGISYEEKQQLLNAGNWRETIDARQQLPEYRHKTVDVVLQRKAEGIYLQVSDEGKGFEWWRYLEIDPSRATHPNGRGIALANKISFDRLQFTQDGSRVLAVVDYAPDPQSRQGAKLEW